MAATLTKAMLDKFMKGNSSIKIKSYTKGGVNLASMDFTDADELFTVLDSFKLSPSDPTITAEKIDQMQEHIGSKIENGEWKVEAKVPSDAKELLDYFFVPGTETIADLTDIKADASLKFKGNGYNEAKAAEVSMLVVSEDKSSAIALAHILLVATPVNIEDHSTRSYIKLSGDILANPLGDKFAVLEADAA